MCKVSGDVVMAAWFVVYLYSCVAHGLNYINDSATACLSSCFDFLDNYIFLSPFVSRALECSERVSERVLRVSAHK